MSRTSPRVLIFLFAAFLSTLACQAVTRLIQPPTPQPAAGMSDAAPTPPPTRVPEVACPAEMDAIVEAAMHAGQNDGGSSVFSRDNKSVILVKYKVDGDTRGEPRMQSSPLEFQAYQDDLKAQDDIWSLFTTLIPADQRTHVTEFDIFTDGRYDLLAAVQQTDRDPYHWILAVDIADASNTRNLVFTLIHELGHLLTLDPSQVPPDLALFNDPNNEDLYNRRTAACPYYFPGEGCSLEQSYINVFYDRFWSDLKDEWAAIDAIENDHLYTKKLDAFYEKYRDQFLDDYAVTSPSEDIAEAWTFFVLGPKPSKDSIAAEKMLFFYEYPELVRDRAAILTNLCAAKP